MQVQGVKLHVGSELKCTFNNIQVHCKFIIVNETVYWLVPFGASGSRKKGEFRGISRDDFAGKNSRFRGNICRNFLGKFH